MSDNFIEEIARAFAERGGQAYGEDVSQLDHALQCAALAAEEDAGDHLIAAALLHDYGHLLEDPEAPRARDARHEGVGAAALRLWFGTAVVRPIALHVQAKRYLCAAEPGYLDRLSDASILSLDLQGGPLSATQCRRFERGPFSPDAIRLRRWDDAAKVRERRQPGLNEYWAALQSSAAATAP